MKKLNIENINAKLKPILSESVQNPQSAILFNDLLANYSVFYQNVYGFHWHIKGQHFFNLHEKFQELYEDLDDKIDAIAERVLALGGMPDHNFSKYLQISTIKETPVITDGNEAIKSILLSLKILIEKQNKIIEYTAQFNDEATNALLSQYNLEQEKLMWMYSSVLQ